MQYIFDYSKIHYIFDAPYEGIEFFRFFINELTVSEIVHFSPLIAAVILFFSFVPLIRKITKNKSVEGISLQMLLFGILQCICFSAFDFANQRYFQLISFLILLALFTVLLIFYFLYASHEKQSFHLLFTYALIIAMLSLILYSRRSSYNIPQQLWLATSYFGFLFGAFRVIPQTLVTLKTKNINNLSYTYFLLHLLAGCIGLNFELQTSGIQSISHILFFIMAVFTNFIQIAYMKVLSFRQIH